MTPLTFQTTPHIISEVGATSQIGSLMAERGCTHVAFVTDRGILDLGLAAQALEGLKQSGIRVTIVSDVVADPPEEMILSAVRTARNAGVDGVVSVGGGSSLDTAKLVALLLGADQPLSDIYGIGQAKGARLPLILAPTTAGTGSEVTPIAIVTTGENEKKGVVAPQLFPDIAVLDASLTVGLPAHVTAATGIDAMVHAIEAFTSKRLKNVVSDCLAKQALGLLGANIHKACSEPDNLEARSDMLLGSMLAGMAFTNAPVAAVHALAYPLGGHFHIPHGHSNALVLPYVMEFNMPVANRLYRELAPLVFPDIRGSDEPELEMVERFKTLGQALGMKSKLSELGVNHNHLPSLATDAMKQERLLINNPREMTYDAALEIYSKAL